MQQGLAIALSFCLLLVNARGGFAYQASSITQLPPQAAQQSSEQLQQLVAPIALYPDTLIAQILAAATYPSEIVEAERWMEQQKALNANDLAREVDKQSWDSSIKALTQFPAVLANMNQNLAWTSELGDAYVNKQQDVSQAVQTMRQRAQAAGNLSTTSQESVSTQGQNIAIQPAASDVVYVPQYDPWLVYGAPLAVFPGWYPYPGLFLDGPGIAFGLTFGVGIFAGFGWGWHNWGFDWRGGGRVVYNHNTFISHSRTIVNRNSFYSNGANFNHAADAHSGGLAGREGTHSSAFSGFNHGGIAKANAFRGSSSFGGSQGGGFRGGGSRGGRR
jgi:hypothetical protein